MDNKVIVQAEFKAKSGQEAALKEQLLKLREPTLAETGCITYDLHEGLNDSSQFFFYEIYENMAALESHRQTDHLQQWFAVMDGYLAQPVKVQLWRVA